MRLIDADAMKVFIHKYYRQTSTVKSILSYIDTAPTFKIPENRDNYDIGYAQGFQDGCDFGQKCYARPKGEWLKMYKTNIASRCSICDWEMPVYGFKYCPNCGSDNRGDGEQ